MECYELWFTESPASPTRRKRSRRGVLFLPFSLVPHNDYHLIRSDRITSIRSAKMYICHESMRAGEENNNRIRHSSLCNRFLNSESMCASISSSLHAMISSDEITDCFNVFRRAYASFLPIGAAETFSRILQTLHSYEDHFGNIK